MTGVGRRALMAAATVAVPAVCRACSGDASPADPQPSRGRARRFGHDRHPTIEESHPSRRPALGRRDPRARRHPDRGRRRSDPATVTAMEKLRTSQRCRLSLADPTIENEELRVAAVDPGAYRTFTPCRSPPTSRTPGTGSPVESSRSRSG